MSISTDNKVSSDVSNLNKSSNEPYTVRAKIGDDNSIDPSTNVVTGDRTTEIFKSKPLDKNDFLSLLVKQLQFQDPLNPQDNTQMVAQLAQFSALEGTTNIEKAISNLDTSFKSTVDAQKYSAQSMTNTSAVSLIGKSVRMRQQAVQWHASALETVPIRVHLGNSSSANVEILDSEGKVVNTLRTKGKDKQNSSEVVWDGLTSEGKIAKAGTYTLHIPGSEADSSLYAFVEDTVEGVRFSGGSALIKIAGKELSIGDVLDVSIGSGGTKTSSSLGLSPGTAVSLLGKDVRVRETSVSFNRKPNEQISFFVNLDGNESVKVEILDSLGQVVKTLPAYDNGGQTGKVVWNGEISGGGYAAPGKYTIRVDGSDLNDNLYAYEQGKVTGISNIGGDTRLRIGSKVLPFSDIIDISDPVIGSTAES